MTVKWSYRAEGRSKIIFDFRFARGKELLELGCELT